MSLINILNEIDKTDAEVYDRLSPRRSVLKNIGSMVALAVIPLGMGSYFKKGKGNSGAMAEALNLELEQKHMKYAFYSAANSVTGLVASKDIDGIRAIERQTKLHIEILNKAVYGLGRTPFRQDSYDFTKGGLNPVFSDFSTFLMTAQVMEEAGIRNLAERLVKFSGHSLFAQMQRIATTDSRHAAYVRLVRGTLPIHEASKEWRMHNYMPVEGAHLHNYEGNGHLANLV